MDTHEWDDMPRNSKWYAEYERRVADFFEKEGLRNLGAQDDPDSIYGEPYFSSAGCSCCGSYLGGNRTLCAGWNEAEKQAQDGYEVCDDCVYYAEYGRLDDMTMLDMDRLDKEASNE